MDFVTQIYLNKLFLTNVRTMCGSSTGSCLSIAGAGCSLTGVGAGEEQVRKVVVGEAFRCGEDK
jgi:hypothetical protein